MFFHLLGVFAQWEREEITERVNASVLTRAKLGKTINGKAPFGYQWKDRKLIPHAEEAAVRRKAYELFLQHRRKGKVAKLLNAAGYRTRKGHIWRDTQLLRILTDPSANGIYYFNRFKQEGDWRRKIKPEDEWGKVECEPIVPESVWNEVNQIIEEQTKGSKRPGKAPMHLFGGQLYCGCGHKMYVRARYPKYFCRKCPNKIGMEDLSDIFYQEMKGFFAEPQRIARHMQKASRNLSEKEALLESHQREIQKVCEEMTRTHRLYLDGEITAKGFGQLYKPAEERLDQLNSELPKLQAEVDLMRVNRLSEDEILHEATTLYDRWPSLPLEDKRKIAESLVEKIVVGEKDIDITFSPRRKSSTSTSEP
jgi:site-specific DNA recombinase